MEKSHNTEPFKLNVLNLFTIQAPVKKITVTQMILLIGVIMLFIIAMIIILKWYAIPALGGPVAINKIGIGIGKLFKSRSP